MRPVQEIAERLGLTPDDMDIYSDPYIAKLRLSVLDKIRTARRLNSHRRLSDHADTARQRKSTTLGLGEAAMKHLGRRRSSRRGLRKGRHLESRAGRPAAVTQVVPMETFLISNLTGDIHAVTAANNLLAAMIDNKLLRQSAQHQSTHSITWKRVVDTNDRALRKIIIGLGGRMEDGIPRETGFDITVASEVMAILLDKFAPGYARPFLARIVVGMTHDKKPVTAEEIGAAGAMTVLMRDAIRPTIMQTLENTPAH